MLHGFIFFFMEHGLHGFMVFFIEHGLQDSSCVLLRMDCTGS
jgi:hypothetical protein